MLKRINSASALSSLQSIFGSAPCGELGSFCSICGSDHGGYRKFFHTGLQRESACDETMAVTSVFLYVMRTRASPSGNSKGFGGLYGLTRRFFDRTAGVSFDMIWVYLPGLCFSMGRVSRLCVEDLLSAVLREELVGGRMSFWFRLEVLPQIGWEFIRMNVYTFIQLAEFSFTSSN